MPPRPLRQGHLDGLCSLYALVNAITIATTNLGDITPRPRALFRHLLRQLDDRGLLFTALTAGLEFQQMMLLLDPCRDWGRYWWGIELVFQHPFHKGGVTPARLLGRLRMDLSRPHSAAVIAMGGALDHWTCIRAVKGRRLWLQDSDGLTYFREATFRRQPRNDLSARWPVSETLIMLQARTRTKGDQYAGTPGEDIDAMGFDEGAGLG